jgi:hypothetical protein
MSDATAKLERRTGEMRPVTAEPKSYLMEALHSHRQTPRLPSMKGAGPSRPGAACLGLDCDFRHSSMRAHGHMMAVRRWRSISPRDLKGSGSLRSCHRPKRFAPYKHVIDGGKQLPGAGRYGYGAVLPASQAVVAVLQPSRPANGDVSCLDHSGRVPELL